ncbi:MAG: GPW/gp25 family protein [Gemmatimonadota bacterium]
MTRQTELQRVTPFLGRDLLLEYTFGGGFFEDADLASARRAGAPVTTNDVSIAEGIPAITQAIANRLKTRKGELTPLGHPTYGSRHHELIGEPNVERTRDLIKLYVLQALRDEPRIEKVLKADVAAEQLPPRDTVRITITVRLVRHSEPLNLVIPFSLESSR